MALHAVMQDSYDVCASLHESVAWDPPLACTEGCVHCCFNQVSLTEPEALYLGFHLLETRTPHQLEEMEARARVVVDAMHGKSRQDIGMMRHLHTCPLLGEATCSVYPARPLVCRGWNSVNVGMCIESNESRDALTPIENHELMRRMAESVQLGLLHGASALGLEAGYLLLARAVVLLLDGGLERNLPEFTDDWLRGKPFFARKREW